MSFANHLEQRSGHYEKGSGKYNNLREQSECMKRFVDDYDINKKKASAWDEVIILLSEIIEQEKGNDNSRERDNIIVYRAVQEMMKRLI